MSYRIFLIFWWKFNKVFQWPEQGLRSLQYTIGHYALKWSTPYIFFVSTKLEFIFSTFSTAVSATCWGEIRLCEWRQSHSSFQCSLRFFSAEIGMQIWQVLFYYYIKIKLIFRQPSLYILNVFNFNVQWEKLLLRCKLIQELASASFSTQKLCSWHTAR